jgi:hypothetical protein
MTLQKFIEANVGKDLGGDTFTYDECSNVITTRTHPLQPNRVTVCYFLPMLQWTFSDLVDAGDIGDNVAFYEWLNGTFFPSMKKAVVKYITTKL